MGIVVFGSVFLDIKGYPIENYIPGGRNAGRVEYVHGGVCRNIAEDIANLELRPTLVSLVDRSGMGDEVLRRLEEHKVNIRYMRRSEDGMGTWLAVFNNSNDVCASISKRPDLSPIRDILADSGDEIFRDADSVLLELDMDHAIVKDIFRLAEEYGKPVFAAVSNIRIAMGRRDFLQRLNCFVCNLEEAGILFARDLSDIPPMTLAQDLAGYIQDARIRSMVITLGADGAVWADADGQFGYTASQPVPVIDTTGAGDAFFAGVSVGLTYGKSLRESCDIGTRLASSVVGTLSSTCPRFLPDEFGLDIPDAR